MIGEVVISALILVGSALALLAAIGLVKMPDVLIRMHASTKTGTLATGLVLAAAAVYFGDLSTVAKIIAIVLFLLITAPVGAHMIGRAAVRSGVKLKLAADEPVDRSEGQ